LNDSSNPVDAPPSERERFTREQEFKERETRIKEEQVLLQREELAAKREESKKTLFNNPLALAVMGATIAAIANVWVAFHNGSEQRAVEETKADNDRKLERQKAEDARIVSAITGETAKATERLRFLLDTHLVADPEIRKFIEAYISTPQIINPPAIAAPTTPPPSTTRRVTVETGRLAGGHNQRDECARLQAQVESQNPGQSVNLVGTSEDSDKDFLGHVTYNYHCTFDIRPS
jgi:cytoskeletal protein RodZ